MKNKILLAPYMVAFTGIVMAVLQSIFSIPKMELPSTIIFCVGFILIGAMVSLMETGSPFWNPIVFAVGVTTACTFSGAFYAAVFAPEFQPVEGWSPDEFLGAYRYHMEQIIYQTAKKIMLIILTILFLLRLILSLKGLLLKG